VLCSFSACNLTDMWQTHALSLFSTSPLVWAHGRVTHITTTEGTLYTGWDPEFALDSAPIPPLVAWTASNLGNIFVPPFRFNTSDIACHFNATPGAIHIDVTAGDELTLKWNEWPVSHVGPIISYLAPCNGPCTGVTGRDLKWTKIDESGWLNDTGWDDLMLGGTWATNELIANDFQWTIKIPQVVAAGYFVLRHEIIALHVAEEFNGAQAYPQCMNLRIVEAKSNTSYPLNDGITGSDLYGVDDKGILVDVHQHIKGYQIPGPKRWVHALSDSNLS
jgi:cellulase